MKISALHFLVFYVLLIEILLKFTVCEITDLWNNYTGLNVALWKHHNVRWELYQ